MSTSHLHYALQLADNALIIGHRISEWCGHGPVLEQDIALANTGLDHIGQARSLYARAATLFNDLSDDDKETALASPLIQQVSGPADEDDMAFLRDGWDFRNVLLTEQPNGDWAQTVVRSYFYDSFQFLLYSKLLNSKDETIAAVAEKSLKEVTYHRRWSSEWVIRLGDGTEESHKRAQAAVDLLWAYAGEMFIPSSVEKAAMEAGIGTDVAALQADWDVWVNSILEEATLTRPAQTWMHQGGKEGRHSEHLGYVLAELQFMQRAYPGMEW